MMEKDCSRTLCGLQDRLRDIMKHGKDIPKTFHSSELCLVCQSVNHIREDLAWYLSNGTETDTRSLMIHQRTASNDDCCHHEFSHVSDNGINLIIETIYDTGKYILHIIRYI